MGEKTIYLSLGILAAVGVVLTGVLIQRVRGFEQRAAFSERGPEEILSPVSPESSPTATFRIPEATSSGSTEPPTEATPSSLRP